MGKAPGVEVEGLDVVRKNLKKIDQDLPKGLRLVHLEISKPIADEARGRAPVRSGQLAASVKAGGTQKAATISAGARLRPYPYGPIVHYGWPGHGITAQPFLTDTMEAAAPGLAADYEQILTSWIDSVWKDT